ncbi:hypothetical protein R1sor_025430 [Riccia sorocarpa]|uniref:Uncharacterized protein n=1 Tax=Riccia sorocarpa TaxID=122646 RepID=A0ABD3G8L8_9MARC
MMETEKLRKASRIRKYWTTKVDPLRRKTRKGIGLPLKRTKGVDVELLRDDAEMQISVWDLAGQEIFRALQSLLLPAVTQACVFVFVFSPFQDNQSLLKENLEDTFKLELKSWLRFVASHYPITGTFLPEVLVVITHKDKMEQYERDLGCELATIVEYFRAQYGRALNLHATPFHMNAWNKVEVDPFVENLFALVSEMLRKKTPQAPSVCCKLISEILDPQHASSKQIVAKPVWKIPDFYNHISKRLEFLDVGSFDQNLENQRRVLEAVILYMHDVGSIFYLPKCQLVVGDINWLTSKFLGFLISEGHGFQVKSAVSRSSSSIDGVVTKGTLVSILKELREICGKKKVNVDEQVLHDLLENLDLCYPIGNVEGVQQYFVPTIFGRSARQEDLTWGAVPYPESQWQYFGYRLLCADSDTTSLSAATFPRFQIQFRKEIVTDDETCVLQRDVIRLDHDREGYTIIVENAEEGTHIDVLIQFSKQKGRDAAMVYVKDHILQEFRKFCASPQGCRGVTLETAIIRPECVQQLTPQKYRKEQIILERQLEAHFRETVERKFNLGVITWPQGDKGGDQDLFNCEHFWKRVPEANLPKGVQQAIELLCERYVEEIMEPLRERSRITVENLREVEQQLDSHLLQSAEGSVRNLGAERHSWRSEGGSSGSTQEDKGLNEIHQHLDNMEERVKEHVDKAIASLSKQLQAIRRDIQQLQELVQSTFTSVMAKIDIVVGYSRALEDAKVPRLPFITFTDVRFSQKMKGTLQIRTPVRLHLMCESRFRPHSVDGQPGLKLTVGDVNKEWLRHISVNALKVFWALVKAGVDAQLPGVGGLIPELGDLSGGLVPVTEMTLQELKNAKFSTLPTVERSGVADDVWKFLRNTVQPATVPEDFKLELVRYNPGTVAVDQTYAWLCQKCVDKGEKNHVLKCI